MTYTFFSLKWWQYHSFFDLLIHPIQVAKYCLDNRQMPKDRQGIAVYDKSKTY